MTYDDFIEARDLMLKYAQNAINIYDEIYDQLPDKFKSKRLGEHVPNVKSILSVNRGFPKPYIVDNDEAIFETWGIAFTEEDYQCGDIETNTIRVYGDWIIPDEDKQRELIQKFIDEECEEIKEYIERREAENENKRRTQAIQKEKRDREEYLRLKKKFENG